MYFGRPELSHKKIAEKLDVNDKTVSYWLRNPRRFYPYIDETALQRALEGNKKCFDALTIWERDLFWDGLQKKRMSMGRKAWMEWVQNFAGLLGFKEGGQIGDALHKRYWRWIQVQTRSAPTGPRAARAGACSPQGSLRKEELHIGGARARSSIGRAADF